MQPSEKCFCKQLELMKQEIRFFIINKQAQHKPAMVKLNHTLYLMMYIHFGTGRWRIPLIMSLCFCVTIPILINNPDLGQNLQGF
ncbi:MAG: hypothetical protein DRR19_31100 [Candidatus Parabeggiatoa sp. nov. 1]|nr:MAG: hypothetical protein DRR19_31100 [Gammaproteobacteria bacterium]